jgi:hypothetical protein
MCQLCANCVPNTPFILSNYFFLPGGSGGRGGGLEIGWTGTLDGTRRPKSLVATFAAF